MPTTLELHRFCTFLCGLMYSQNIDISVCPLFDIKFVCFSIAKLSAAKVRFLKKSRARIALHYESVMLFKIYMWVI